MSDPHAAPTDSHAEHAHAAPTVPMTVKDEAGDTPTWLPMVGLVLLAALAFFVVYRLANPHSAAESAAAGPDGGVADGAVAEPAAEPAAAPAAAPAPQPAR